MPEYTLTSPTTITKNPDGLSHGTASRPRLPVAGIDHVAGSVRTTADSSTGQARVRLPGPPAAFGTSPCGFANTIARRSMAPSSSRDGGFVLGLGAQRPDRLQGAGNRPRRSAGPTPRLGTVSSDTSQALVPAVAREGRPRHDRQCPTRGRARPRGSSVRATSDQSELRAAGSDRRAGGGRRGPHRGSEPGLPARRGPGRHTRLRRVPAPAAGSTSSRCGSTHPAAPAFTARSTTTTPTTRAESRPSQRVRPDRARREREPDSVHFPPAHLSSLETARARRLERREPSRRSIP